MLPPARVRHAGLPNIGPASDTVRTRPVVANAAHPDSAADRVNRVVSDALSSRPGSMPSTAPLSLDQIGLTPVPLPETSARPPVDLVALRALAEELVTSRTLPAGIRTPAQALAIILAGREMGVEPMTALRSISFDRGKVIVAADLQLALYKRDGGHAEWVENRVSGVALRLRHPNGDEYVSTFTAEDARRAGLWGKPGPWSQYPVAMMRARAITAGLKAIGYAPTAGAYDSVSEELPTAMPVVPSSPIATPTARSGVEDGPASMPTLVDIEDAIRWLELVCPDDAAVAASQYAKLKGELEGSEARAKRFLARLLRRLDVLTHPSPVSPTKEQVDPRSISVARCA